ncbi:MAG: DUF2911 domain-containing protein [Lacunisphaera sp.]|nr:DUF2911 domain-containing protein [Lacunisphaera sp.]
MKSRVLLAAVAGATLFTSLCAQPAAAAPVPPPATTVAPPATARARVSPHEIISLKVDGNRVTLIYGRPYSKDPKSGEIRKIWGTLVPYGKVWRTGSDEATTLITQQAIDLGGTVVPAGTYTLFTVPLADGSAKLVVNKESGQWGVDPYHEANELARIDLKKDPLNTSLDQFVMALEKNPAGGAVLKLAWETTQYSVSYTVKK